MSKIHLIFLVRKKKLKDTENIFCELATFIAIGVNLKFKSWIESNNEVPDMTATDVVSSGAIACYFKAVFACLFATEHFFTHSILLPNSWGFS